jgi:hypothetical protein
MYLALDYGLGINFLCYADSSGQSFWGVSYEDLQAIPVIFMMYKLDAIFKVLESPDFQNFR